MASNRPSGARRRGGIRCSLRSRQRRGRWSKPWQPDLFAEAEAAGPVAAADPVARLLASPRLQRQRTQAGRMAPETATLETTLRLLEAGQG